MSTLRTPDSETLLTTIKACLQNGDRFLEETYDLEFRDPPASRYFIVMIAQEEFAKAFIIYLIREGAMPFTLSVLRAINDHVCKQLIGMVMDYMIMHWDEIDEMRTLIAKDFAAGDALPNDVGSAIEILRYERIGAGRADLGYGLMIRNTILQPLLLRVESEIAASRILCMSASAGMAGFAACQLRLPSRRLRRSWRGRAGTEGS